jgi:hypothetical protein
MNQQAVETRSGLLSDGGDAVHNFIRLAED